MKIPSIFSNLITALIISGIPAIALLVIIPPVFGNLTGYAIAVLLLIIILLFYLFLSDKENLMARSNFCRLFLRSPDLCRKDFVFSIIYFLAIIAVIVIPPNYSLYSNWGEIALLNWIRLIASFLLTSFLSGYVILRVIDNGKRIRGAAFFAFSFLLSFFVTTVIGLALELTGNRISQYGFSSLVLFSIPLACISLFWSFHNERIRCSHDIDSSSHGENRLQTMLLLCMVALQCLLLYNIFFTNPSFIRGDMWTHFADAGDLLKYGFQNQLTFSGYFWGYRLFEAMFLVLSGFPLINAEIMLVFLYPISIIAFYSMASMLFKKSAPKVPIVATFIWTIFSGFDWVYLLSQGSLYTAFSFNAVYPVVSSTMSGVIYPYSTFGYDHMPFMVSIITVFMLLYLFKSSNLKLYVKVFLVTLTTLLGYLVHSTEVMLFIILFIPVLLIFTKGDHFGEVRIGIISMLVGLFGMLILDYSVPGEPIYTTTYGLPISIALVSIAFSITFVFRKLSLRKNLLKMLEYKHTQKLFFGAILVVGYLYLLSFVALYDSPLSSQGFSIGTLQHVIPWFTYSLRLGCAGILLIACAAYIIIKRKFSEPLLFCLAVTILSVIFERVYVILYPIDVATTHNRIFYVMFITVSIVAAWIVPKIFSMILKSNLFGFSKAIRHFIISLFLVTIVLAGSLSTVISSEYWAAASGPFGLPQNNMPMDIEALTYLRNNSPSLSTVVTNDISNDSIQAFVASLASVRTLDTDQFNSWFGTTQPNVLYALKNLLNVSYVYLSPYDLAAVSQNYPNSYFINHLIKYLPNTTFTNSDVSIYKIPSLYPSTGNNLSIILPTSINDYILLSVETFAASRVQYNVRPLEYSDSFESSTIVLPFDPLLTPKNSYLLNNQSEFWTAASWGLGSIDTPMLSSANSTENDLNYVNVLVKNGSESKWGIYHDYSQPENWAEKDTLNFMWYGAGSNYTFTIEIRAPDVSNQHFFYFKDDFIGWKEISVPLQDFSNLERTKFDLSRIGRIFIYPTSDNILGNYRISPIFVSKTSNTLTQSQLSKYTDWVNAGGHLVVLDNLEEGYFASLFGLEVIGNKTVNGIANKETSINTHLFNATNFSISDPDATVIANYTLNERSMSPFAVSKPFGKGQITYALTKSFYDAMTTASNQTTRQSMFSKIGNLINFFNISSRSYTQPNYYDMLSSERIGISAATGNFSGSIVIKSDSIIFDGTEFDRLDLEHANLIYSDNTLNSVRVLTNVTVIDVTTNGPSSLTIQATKAQVKERQIFPDSSGTFLPLIFSDGFSMDLAMSNETSIVLNLEVNNTALRVILKGGLIHASASPANSSVMLENPDLTVIGQAILDKAWFRRPYSVYQQFVVHGSPIILTGETSFVVPLSESDKIYLSNFKFNGTYVVLQEKLTSEVAMFFSYDSWGINWSKVLLSPFNLLLIENLILIIYIIFKRLKLKANFLNSPKRAK